MKAWFDYITVELEMSVEEFNRLDYRTRNSYWEEFLNSTER